MTYLPDIVPWPEEFEGKLPLSEMFYSIQGEGRFAGYPALFIRLMYCNLGCAWCDTKFTWERGSIDTSQLLEATDLAEEAVSLLGDSVSSSVAHVVITGGEPMLHQDRLPALIDALRRHGFRFFEIETNGMFTPTDELAERVSWWNCSPKLTNNGRTVADNIQPEALKRICETGRSDFKFVIQSRRDLDELEATFLPHIPQESILLMPEGTSPERLNQVGGWLIEECRKRGYRFSPRLHIMMWGNQRGR